MNRTALSATPNPDPHWCCIDCGKDTDSSQEYYMLHDDLWRQLVRRPHRKGMLCLDCAERRLGRDLNAADFKNVPVNAQQAKVCPALARRLSPVTAPTGSKKRWRVKLLANVSAERLKQAKRWRRR